MAVDKNLLASIVAGLDETEAIHLLHDLERRFNWVATVFTPEDIEMAYCDYTGAETAPDEEVDKVMATYYWRHLADTMIEAGFAYLGLAIEEVNPPTNETGEEE